MTFRTNKLAVICSYPSDNSYYFDEKGKDTSKSVVPEIIDPSSGLSSYQPSSMIDLGTVIQRERERIQFVGDALANEKGMQLEIQLNTEGDHFNSHQNQEGGHAMLF